MPEPSRAKGRGGLEAKCHEHIVEVVRLGRGEVGRLCWLQRAVALQRPLAEVDAVIGAGRGAWTLSASRVHFPVVDAALLPADGARRRGGCDGWRPTRRRRRRRRRHRGRRRRRGLSQ